MFVLSYFEQGMYTFDYKYVIKKNSRKFLVNSSRGSRYLGVGDGGGGRSCSQAPVCTEP